MSKTFPDILESKDEYTPLKAGDIWPTNSREKVDLGVSKKNSISDMKNNLSRSNNLSLRALGLAFQEGRIENYPENLQGLSLVKGKNVTNQTFRSDVYGFMKNADEGFSIILAKERLRTCNSKEDYEDACENHAKFLKGNKSVTSFLVGVEDQEIDLKKLTDVASIFGVLHIFEGKLQEELAKQEQNSKIFEEVLELENRPPSPVIKGLKRSDSSSKLAEVQMKDDKVLEILHDLIFAFNIDERWGKTGLSKLDVIALITDLQQPEYIKGETEVNEYLGHETWKANFDGLFQKECYQQKIAKS